MRRHSSPSLASLLILAMTLTACGGGSGGGSPAASSAPSNQTNPTPPNPDSPPAPEPLPPGPAPRHDVKFSVHLTAINGEAALDHPVAIYVHPGDVIRFSADAFRNGSPLQRPSSDFSWRAGSGAVCDAANEESCYNTGFLLDDFGVDYVVPENFGSGAFTIAVGLTRDINLVDGIELRSLGYEFNYNDPRYHELPRWNPEWDHDRRGRWEPGWDHQFHGNRPHPEPHPEPRPLPPQPRPEPPRPQPVPPPQPQPQPCDRNGHGFGGHRGDCPPAPQPTPP
ncbi:MAG: hypothetical protein ACXWSC_17640, partial [Bdellovibrionota bacterium]